MIQSTQRRHLVIKESWLSNSPEETRALANSWIRRWEPGSIIALHGEVGAGKTCFAQGLAEGLDIAEPVMSPTYTVIHEYKGKWPFYHIDLYRLNDPLSILEAGIEEYFDARGITVIEWPERYAENLPCRTQHIILKSGVNQQQRVIKWAEWKS